MNLKNYISSNLSNISNDLLNSRSETCGLHRDVGLVPEGRSFQFAMGPLLLRTVVVLFKIVVHREQQNLCTCYWAQYMLWRGWTIQHYAI